MRKSIFNFLFGIRCDINHKLTNYLFLKIRDNSLSCNFTRMNIWINIENIADILKYYSINANLDDLGV